jgi:hypothetical protein
LMFLNLIKKFFHKSSMFYAYYPSYRSKNNCNLVLCESKGNKFCPALTRTGFRFKKQKIQGKVLQRESGTKKSVRPN